VQEALAFLAPLDEARNGNVSFADVELNIFFIIFREKICKTLKANRIFASVLIAVSLRTRSGVADKERAASAGETALGDCRMRVLIR